ncbi:MAG: carboxylesterase family protein [Bacteroidota bacterium]
MLKIRLYVSVILLISLSLTGLYAGAQIEPISPGIHKQSFIYAVKDSAKLGLDVYNNTSGTVTKKPCVLFIFGGAFIAGHRDDSIYNKYFNSLVDHDYVLISISYRLGLKGAKHLSKYNIAPLRKAVSMAIEDVYDATNWVIENSAMLGIDTGKIILSGSSSGAITVLGADFRRRNNMEIAQKLPAGFQYAGVVSFSGAVLSFNGSLKYAIPPAPTLLFHGSADKIVPYNKIRFLNKGFYGSSWIARTFKKEKYPFYIYRAEGLGHEMAVLPMYNQLPLILDFLDRFVMQKKPLQVDMSYDDPAIKPLMILTPKELFKKLQQKSAE